MANTCYRILRPYWRAKSKFLPWQEIVTSDSFGDVKSGALMSAIFKMTRGVEKMEKTTKEAETVAKREQSKSEALRGTFESLKGNISVMCRVRRVKTKDLTCSFPLEDTVNTTIYCRAEKFFLLLKDPKKSLCRPTLCSDIFAPFCSFVDISR